MHGDAHKMDLFTYLLSRPIRINGIDSIWCPLSLLAKAQGSEKKMELLLARGADINRRSANGKSILFLTCQTDVPAERIDFLCQQGANVHLSSNGETPLALCFLLNKVSFATELIRHGAIIPDTAMEYALELKYIDIVKLLVEQGVPFPTDALQLAIDQGKTEKVRILIVHYAPLYIEGDSALFYPLQGGLGYIHTLIVQYLCAAGANVNESSVIQHKPHSEEPVLYDLIRQYIYTKNEYILEIIKILIEFGAIPPPHTEYSYVQPFYSNPSMYSEMNAILLRARIA
jgi:ankyrin repeat protein